MDYVYISQLGHVVPKLFSEDFQDQALEETHPFFTYQQGKLPWTCWTYVYSLYSVELDLHDRKVCCEHQYQGLTSLNHRSMKIIEVFG
jgi:hypothetical protein